MIPDTFGSGTPPTSILWSGQRILNAVSTEPISYGSVWTSELAVIVLVSSLVRISDVEQLETMNRLNAIIKYFI